MPRLREILVVDDSPVNRQILRKILHQEYKVLEAENGQKALDILKSRYQDISAVLLDIVMPVMDGFEFLACIHEDTALSKIPVIVTTVNDNEDAELRALSLGAHDFLAKPYRPAVILHRLANTINLRETAALVNAVEKDALTGLYSKEFFYKKAAARIGEKEQEKFDILCMDIERFKLINDLFGSQTGDSLLRYLADMMMELSKGLGICGRVGADQFACLLPHQARYDDDLFSGALEKISRFPISITINVCYGIYTIDEPSVPISVMCDRALIACASVKGRYDIHYAYYNDAFRQTLLAEQVMIDGMRTAIANRQFHVYYQPKYELATEKVIGAEALVRWLHPEKGLMMPGEFIPLFERNGFIADLDSYVWETVCRDISDLLHSGHEVVPISVNVSRTDIYNPKLASLLTALLKKYNLEARYIHLEITESAYTENPEQIISAAKQLRTLGFTLEMDDFGTGYSSLNMLSELPIQVLKLDMKFIQAETEKQNSRNILSFVVGLAKWLQLLVVAEGVETVKQARTLKAMGCDYAQGVYYAGPMPVESFQAYLKKARLAAEEEERLLPQPWERPGGHQRAPEKIMVIADAAQVDRAVLTEIFGGLYTVLEAENGRQAYRYIQANYEQIAVILLDLVMPVMDGFQLFEKLKNDARFKNIPIIITSYTDEGSEARALDMGASDFIAKPYDREVALRRVGNVLAESRLQALERERELSMEVEEMKFRAEHDSLTGLYNRIAMETMVNRFFATSKRVDSTFIMLDLDNFKMVNDVFGHDKGDELLIRVAGILTDSFRDADMVTRLGGDEFAIFVPALLPVADLERRGQRLCERLRMDFNGIHTAATIGIASAPIHGADYQTLYKHADTALLAAKRMGKDQYRIFDTHMEMPLPVLDRNTDWLLDEAGAAVLVCDTESYEVLYVNRGAADLAGREKNACIGKKCYEILWNGTEPCAHCVALHQLTRVYCEHEFSDVERGAEYIIKGKLTDWGGRPARLQYIQDNTRRSQIKHQLEKTNDRLTGMLSALQSGLVKCRTDENWTVVEANDRFYEALGYTRKTFHQRLGNHLTAAVAPDFLNGDLNSLKKQLACDGIARLESCLIDSVGTRVPVTVRVVQKTETDGESYYYCTYIQESAPDRTGDNGLERAKR